MKNTLILRKDQHYSASRLNLQTKRNHSRRIDLEFAKTSSQTLTLFKIQKNDPILENSGSLVSIGVIALVSV